MKLLLGRKLNRNLDSKTMKRVRESTFHISLCMKSKDKMPIGAYGKIGKELDRQTENQL